MPIHSTRSDPGLCLSRVLRRCIFLHPQSSLQICKCASHFLSFSSPLKRTDPSRGRVSLSLRFSTVSPSSDSARGVSLGLTGTPIGEAGGRGGRRRLRLAPVGPGRPALASWLLLLLSLSLERVRVCSPALPPEPLPLASRCAREDPRGRSHRRDLRPVLSRPGEGARNRRAPPANAGGSERNATQESQIERQLREDKQEGRDRRPE